MKLREYPQCKLDPRVLSYWKLKEKISLAVWLVISLAIALALAYFFSLKIALIVGLALAFIGIVNVMLEILLLIKLRYDYTAYQLNEADVDYCSGAIFRSRKLIPLIRVQNTMTETGPLLRKFGLANLEIETAAGSISIEGLDKEEAEIMRERISALARLAQEDV